MKAAAVPRLGPRRARLLVVDEHGRVSHHAASDLPSLLQRGDLVVANDAATIPASLHGTHVRTGRPVEVRLACRHSLSGDAVTRFTAVVPHDYKKVLEVMRAAEAAGRDVDAAVMEVARA